MKRYSVAQFGLTLLFVVVIVLMFGFIVLLTPLAPVSVWGLIWRMILSLTCVWIITYIIGLGQKKVVGLIEITNLRHGTYLVIGAVCDSVSVKGGGLERDIVLTLRRLENGSRERLIYAFGDDLLGDLSSPLRPALSNNRPAFRFQVEPDDQSAILYQERPGDGERLFELKLDLVK